MIFVESQTLVAAQFFDAIQLVIESTVRASYNQRVIFLGVSILGAVSGLVGTFLLFRKRSLLSDTISHATLPGIAIAYLIGESLYQNGKKTLPLMLGAFVASWLSMQFVRFIRRNSKVKDDAALTITLAFFYGIGVVLLSVIQKLPSSNSSGLEYYLYGMVASMVIGDAYLLIGLALLCVISILLFFKEFSLLCFDSLYAQTQGFPVTRLDVAIMTLSVSVAVVGLQTVGLLLMMALLITPPVAARFWSNDIRYMLLISGIIGATSTLLGAIASSSFSRLPAGGSIVLATGLIFVISLLFGSKKGLCVRKAFQIRLNYKIRETKMLRSLIGILEEGKRRHSFKNQLLNNSENNFTFEIEELRNVLRWPKKEFSRSITRLERKAFIRFTHPEIFVLTPEGFKRGLDCMRNQRLTELYLLQYPESAPQKICGHEERIKEIVDSDIYNELRKIYDNDLQRINNCEITQK